MKSINKIIITGSLVVVSIAVNSCTDNFPDLNTPANLITENLVTPELLLTSVEYNAVLQGMEAGDVADYCGMSAQDDNLPFEDRFYDDPWNKTYTTYANNLASIIRITEDEPQLINKKAIARILKVWVFSQATDIYGDIPYFEANRAPDEAISTPRYDSQKSIYEDFFKELREATAELDPSEKSYGPADLIYKGDVAKWKKFANSLRLRLALRVRYADAAMAQVNIGDLQEADLILSRRNDAVIFTSNTVPQHRNTRYNYLVDLKGLNSSRHIGKTILDILKNNNDPRIGIYADTATLDGSILNPPQPPFGYRGHPVLGRAPVEEKYAYGAGSTSNISNFWYVPEIEKPVLRSSEVYFALAEAALFNLRSGDANDYFKKGIEAGILETQDFYNRSKDQMPGVLKIIYPNWTDAEINSYLTYKEMKQDEIDAFLLSPATVLTGSDEEKLEQIMNQKILVLPNNGLEGWAEWRRTGYPRVLVSSNEGSALQGVSYRRHHYPQNETLINSKNNAEAVGRMGSESVLNKVWWDANPLSPHEHPGVVESRPAPWIN